MAISLRPIGNPLPLGLFALAAGTLTLAALQLGWVPKREMEEISLVLVGFVAPLQFLTAIFGFLSRDGIAADGFGLLAGTWTVIGLVGLAAGPGSTSGALGIFLLAVAVLLLAPALGSWSTKAVAAAVLMTAALRFATTAVYELSGAVAWERITGVVGLVLFLLAAYGGLAAILAAAGGGRGPLPLGRGHSGEPHPPGPGVADAPGVRRRL